MYHKFQIKKMLKVVTGPIKTKLCREEKIKMAEPEDPKLTTSHRHTKTTTTYRTTL